MWKITSFFRTRKFIVLIIFLSFLLKGRNAAYQCHFHRESANENKQCIQTKTCISNLYLMGTVVNRALLSLPGEITLTVPLIQVSTRFCLIWFRTFRDFLIFALLASIMGSQESYTRNSKSLNLNIVLHSFLEDNKQVQSWILFEFFPGTAVHFL